MHSTCMILICTESFIILGPCTYRPFDFYDMALGIKNVFDVDVFVYVKEKAKHKTFLRCGVQSIKNNKGKTFFLFASLNIMYMIQKRRGATVATTRLSRDVCLCLNNYL